MSSGRLNWQMVGWSPMLPIVLFFDQKQMNQIGCEQRCNLYVSLRFFSSLCFTGTSHMHLICKISEHFVSWSPNSAIASTTLETKSWSHGTGRSTWYQCTFLSPQDLHLCRNDRTLKTYLWKSDRKYKPNMRLQYQLVKKSKTRENWPKVSLGKVKLPHLPLSSPYCGFSIYLSVETSTPSK